MIVDKCLAVEIRKEWHGTISHHIRMCCCTSWYVF